MDPCNKSAPLYFAAFILTCILFPACSTSRHYYYLQNAPQAPLFSEKKDAALSVSLHEGSESTGKAAQAAFAVTDRLAVMAEWMDYRNKNNSSINGVSGGNWNCNYGEAAVGYFRSYKNFFTYEFYGGFGYGKQLHNYAKEKTDTTGYFFSAPITSTYFVSTGSCRLGFNKFFVQANCGKAGKYFDVALCMRLSNIYFSKVDNQAESGTDGYAEGEAFRQNRNYMLAEPSIVLRGGPKYFKLQLRYGLTGIMAGRYFRPEDSYISLGAYMSLSAKYRAEANKK